MSQLTHYERLRREGKIITTLVKMNPEQHAALKSEAQAQRRSIHSQILYYIEKGLRADNERVNFTVKPPHARIGKKAWFIDSEGYVHKGGKPSKTLCRRPTKDMQRSYDGSIVLDCNHCLEMIKRGLDETT